MLIGDQEWMAENLRATRNPNGISMAKGLTNEQWQSTNQGVYAIYYNDYDILEAYGKLYNGYVVNDDKGLCPDGWSVPSEADWTLMVKYVVSQGYPNEGENPNGAGNDLKSRRQVDHPDSGDRDTSEHSPWFSHGTHSGFDEFGFSALTGGYRWSDGSFGNVGYNVTLCSATEGSNTNAWLRDMVSGSESVRMSSYSKSYEFSGRSFRRVKLEVETLAELREMPEDGTEYLYTGEAVITAMDSFRNRKFIQDETAAILIDDPQGIITTEYDLYDEITNVVGQIDIFHGMVRFQPEENTDEALDNTPIDPEFFMLDAVTKDDQSKLLMFESVTFTHADQGSGDDYDWTPLQAGDEFENGKNYLITDGENEFIVRTDFWNLDYIGEEIPHDEVNLSGVILYDWGELKIVPRDAADIDIEVLTEFYEVTFQVDLSAAISYGFLEGFDPHEHHIMITGSMFDWVEPDPGNDDILLDWIEDDPMTYDIRLLLEAGEYEYKYFSDLIGHGWDGYEWSGNALREINVAADITVYDTWGFIEPEEPDIVYGDGVTDINGNEYVTVIIGDQEWMAENLRVTKYQNGESITTDLSNNEWENTTSGAYAIYNNDEDMLVAYGKLYNWYAVDDPRGLCPEGWHVPSNDDWTQLVDYLIGEYGYHNDWENDDVNGVGNALKSCRQAGHPEGGDCDVTEHPRWGSNNTHYGFDEFGFSALPGGSRWSDGSFGNVGKCGYWWSADEHNSTDAHFRYLCRQFGGLVWISNGNKPRGNSIRCVRGKKEDYSSVRKHHFYIEVSQPHSLIANAGEDVEITAGESITIGGNPSAEFGYGNYTYQWTPDDYLDDANVPNPIATPPATTEYHLLVTDEKNCTAESLVNVSVKEDDTNIAEITAKDIQVFPNPANSILNIVAEHKIKKIFMYNMQGQLVYSASVGNKSHNIYVPEINQGVYVLRILTKDGVHTQMVQITRQGK